MEKAMFRRLNRDRRSQKLPALVYDDGLAAVARAHSLDMRSTRLFDHVSPVTGTLEDRLARAGVLFSTARENLSEAPGIEESQEGLLKSPGHYANIMAENVTHVGIGIVRGGVKDPRNILVTQVFSTPRKRETAEAAARAVLKVLNETRRKNGRRPLRPDERVDALAAVEIHKWPMPPRQENLSRAGRNIGDALSTGALGPVGGVIVDGPTTSASPSAKPWTRKAARR
jgi:uncharacterized protein YkwD